MDTLFRFLSLMPEEEFAVWKDDWRSRRVDTEADGPPLLPKRCHTGLDMTLKK